MERVCCVGAGITGATVANILATNGFLVDVIDARSHVAGNCHTERDDITGVMKHVYGPHIFHTDNEAVWQFVNKFDSFYPFVNRVKAISSGRVYPLPINLLTINTLFGKTLNPINASEFVKSLVDNSIIDPVTFEEQALKFVGRDIYETFFKSYTLKQWGRDPKELPASILKRIPVRFDYNDNYYNSKYQGMPINGYTYIVEKMLDAPSINVFLERKFEECDRNVYTHVFFTGAIDSYFNYKLGRLPYRTLDFVNEYHEGDFQGNAVINYCDNTVPWTRISEHKHFSPWESHTNTVISKEYSRECNDGDLPYYPVRLRAEQTQLDRYIELAKLERNTTFVGRLATYRYLDMDVAIHEAILTAKNFITSRANNLTPAVFLEI